MSIYLRTEPIIPDWTDYNGHMNLAFYIHLFDQGWDVLLDKFEMGGDSAKIEKRSTFAVESHTKYIKEVKEGDLVDINLLFLDRDSKRFVYQLEIVNKNGDYRAATTEVCSVYVNLDIRRVTEIEPHKLKLVDHIVSIVGWVEHEGDQYWVIRNSWGEYWGNMGYLFLKLGENQLGIESECAWAVPDTWTEINVPCSEDGIC